VRNTFTHDARVLRAARVLRDRGFDPLVVAVMSTEIRRRHDLCDAVPVLRLDPTSPFGLLRNRLAPEANATSAPANTNAAPAAPGRGFDATALGRLAVRLHRWMRTLDFYRRALGVVRRERPALVHCNDYNTMWVGVLARAVFRAAVVYDSHELWPDRNLRPEPRWWLLACEAMFVRVAHTVVVASPGYAEVMARRYRIPSPAVVRNIPAGSRPVRASAASEPEVAVYAGGLLPHRGLEPFIEALALLPTLRLRLLGPGRAEYVAGLRAHATRLGVVDRVELLGPVDSSQVVETIRGAAFGVALFQPVCLSHRLVAPNKLFEYVAAGLPSLASDLPVMRAFVDEWQLGLTAPPTDVQRIAKAASALLDPAANRRFRTGAAAASRTVTWERESRMLERAYEQALAAA
jgi:glycosyltransferase involved in cell wall biosynthesis